MKNGNLIRYTLAVGILVAVAAGIARAQSSAPPEQQPGIGRVSLIQGNVSMQRGDSQEWTAVTPNTPLASGDTISTGPGSHAEVQLDWASVLRLSDGASARFANLSPSQIQIQVGQGTVNVSVLQASEAAVEIDTPNVAIYPLGPGSYRVMVNSDDETQLVVRSGSADVSTPQGSARAERGQLITVQGPENQQQYQSVAAAGPDDWDRWNDDRDRLINGAASWQHTNRYYVGSQDLDAYGQWTNVDEYGPVWAPAVAPDWAPYRAGRWVWEPFYGWTWVSYEPWGWAPYHYGRWFTRGSSWYWWPGPVGGGYRPQWAPAYVSFFGFGGGGISVGVGFGSVGWLPIGPSDSFFPWYGRWGGRVNAINVANIYNTRNFYEGGRSIGPLARQGMRRYSNFDEAFNNPRMRQGITSMGANQFGRSGVPVHQTAITAESFRGGRLMTGGMPVTPTRESFRSTDWGAHRDSIPSRAPASRRFMNNPRGAGGARPNGQPPAQMNPRRNNFPNPGGAAPGGSRGNAFPSAAQRPDGRGFGAGNSSGPGNSAGPGNSSGWSRGRQGSGMAPGTGSGMEPGAGPAPVPGNGMGVPRRGFPGWSAEPGGAVPPSTGRPGNRGGGPGFRGNGAVNGGAGGPAPSDGAAAPQQAVPQQFEPGRGGRRGFPPGAMPESQGGAPAQEQRRRGWQGFDPNRSGPPDGGARSVPAPGPAQSYPSRPAPAYEGGRGGRRGADAGGGPRNDTRPALDLGQPIVRERGGSPTGFSRDAGGNRGGGSGGRGPDNGRSNYRDHSSRGR